MVKIISDSTCDLSQELLERYDISILPLQVTLGEESYEDGVDITVDEIYRWADENKTTPKTAASSIETAKNSLRAAGYTILEIKEINALILRRAGVRHIDISTECTKCRPDRFWSHRITGLNRGSQGAIIIRKEETK